MLVLGAGANGGSENRRHKAILMAQGLAQEISEQMGETYNGEEISEVVTAAHHIIGKDAVNRILIENFRFCKPSKSLSSLFNYSWNRVYTWNYDDAIEQAVAHASQRTHIYNGMRDAVEEIDQSANLQLVFLHGQISKLDHGIILSKEEYAEVLQRGGHEWYKELASDYRSHLVIFIGSSLREPVMEAEIQRASRPENDLGGYSFLITPDKLSGIRKSALEARKIIHSEGTIDTFVTWLGANLGPKIEPRDLIRDDHFFTDENLESFNFDDLEAAHSIIPIIMGQIREVFLQNSESRQDTISRLYLLGFPVSWQIAAAGVPVTLEQTSILTAELRTAITDQAALFVVTGQAGSGKSTAAMQSLLELSQEGSFDVFELDSAVKSVTSALGVLRRLSDRPKLVYLRNLFVFGTQLADLFQEARAANVTFVSTARSGEWEEHFRRHFEPEAVVFQFQRFQSADYQPLIDKLVQFVPAPSFVKLSNDKRLERLRKSKNQLLIALREATESRNFDEIIFDEYQSLGNSDVQALFVLVGLCTLARVGVSPSQAAEAYQRQTRDVPFKEALERLAGIVEPGQGGRLIARHEFYVRKILDSLVTIDQTIVALKDLLSTFTKYQIPITKHVTRTDAALFRFLLNHSFIRERAERAGARERGIEVYKSFEVDFQLDGHFWLQYGLYYQRLNEGSLALEMLEKSVQAFPGNPFAIHALASQRLHQASSRLSFDHETKHLITSAVADLERLDRSDWLYFDQYPLVTLSRYHIDSLLQHGRSTEAIGYAKEYFERLKVLERKQSTNEITNEKSRLLTLLTTTEWIRPGF